MLNSDGVGPMEIKKHGSGLAPDLLRNHRDDSGCLIVPESMPEATMGKAKCVSAQQFRLISRGGRFKQVQ